MKFSKIISIICLLLFALAGRSTELSDSAKTTPSGVIGWLERYFAESNKTKPEKKFDFSIIGGPHYSSDTKFGIGLVAAGLYRHDRSDLTIQPSNVTLFSDVSTAGFCMVGIRGNHFFPDDRFRLNYKAYFYSFPTYFWGIGYVKAANKANKTKYKRLQTKVAAEFLIRLAPSLYIGPKTEFQYVEGRNVERLELWNYQTLYPVSVSSGITATYDTRDYVTAPSTGVCLTFDQLFFPRCFGNGNYNFSLSEITASIYTPVWEGGVLAAQGHARFTYGNTPWSMLSTFGGSENMRGYYDGQYRDKNEADAVIELRQHVYGRSGAVAWLGAGNVFPDLKNISVRHSLPNFGIGYRWEFKHKVNIRLDYGFGRHTSGFVFSINEAF